MRLHQSVGQKTFHINMKAVNHLANTQFPENRQGSFSTVDAMLSVRFTSTGTIVRSMSCTFLSLSRIPVFSDVQSVAISIVRKVCQVPYSDSMIYNLLQPPWQEARPFLNIKHHEERNLRDTDR